MARRASRDERDFERAFWRFPNRHFSRAPTDTEVRDYGAVEGALWRPTSPDGLCISLY
jgi:hypothetical protein